MVALQTPEANIGWNAPDFELEGTDGKIYNLETAKGQNGLVVMFICNHCPFVKSILDKIIRDTKELKEYGVNSIAIMSNDPNEYEEDSFSNMKIIAKEQNFPFPYVIDKTQEIAKKYDAVCTPDFFGFDKDLELKYRGRLDESKMNHVPEAERELFNAMVDISKNSEPPKQQIPSIGCSIKWIS